MPTSCLFLFHWCLSDIKDVFVAYKQFPVTCSKLVVHHGSKRWKGSSAKCSKTVNISVAFCYGRSSGFSVCLFHACGGSAVAGYLSLGQDDSSSRWLTSVWKCGTNDTLLIWSGKVEYWSFKKRRHLIQLWMSDIAAILIFDLIKESYIVLTNYNQPLRPWKVGVSKQIFILFLI